MNTVIRRTVRFPDGIISFLEWEAPKGAPVLVFAHANGFNASTYRRLLEPLAGEFRVLALDMRGHGETALPTDSRLARGWRAFRDDLLRFLDRLQIRPDVLAGHSLGASAIVLAAAARQDIARAIVVAEPVMAADRTAFGAAVARLRGRSGQVVPLVAMALKRRAQFKSREEAIKSFTGRGPFRTWPQEMVADYIEGGLVAEGDAFRLACDPAWEAASFATYPFRMGALGSRIKIPVTILSGTVNSATAPPVLAEFIRRQGQARSIVIEGASHFLPMEHPDRVREEIRRALSGRVRTP
ncbi:MAG: alpha/beta hydrolase [Rhizomicrobium sp.]